MVAIALEVVSYGLKNNNIIGTGTLPLPVFIKKKKAPSYTNTDQEHVCESFLAEADKAFPSTTSTTKL